VASAYPGARKRLLEGFTHPWVHKYPGPDGARKAEDDLMRGEFALSRIEEKQRRLIYPIG